MVWVATVVAHTDARATFAPTDRSMPPPMMTKVMPMLTTPMTEPRRRMVRVLSTLAKRSPPVTTPTMIRMIRASTRPRLRPTEPRKTFLSPDTSGAESSGPTGGGPAAATVAVESLIVRFPP